MSAEPLTRKDWSLLCGSIDPRVAARIEATFEAGGYAPEEPTPYQLDEWAAEKIMGWELSGNVWVKTGDTLSGFRNIFNRKDWKPSVDLGQALECVKAAGRRCQAIVFAKGQLAAFVDGGPVVQDASNTAELAEAIVRKLYAEVGS